MGEEEEDRAEVMINAACTLLIYLKVGWLVGWLAWGGGLGWRAKGATLVITPTSFYALPPLPEPIKPFPLPSPFLIVVFPPSGPPSLLPNCHPLLPCLLIPPSTSTSLQHVAPELHFPLSLTSLPPPVCSSISPLLSPYHSPTHANVFSPL